MDIQALAIWLKSKLGDEVVIAVDEVSSPHALTIKAEQIATVCKTLHEEEETYFDLLSCITGIDNGVEANTMEVVYNLYSIPYHQSLMLKVVLDRAKPELLTVSTIWKTALWHEREAYDLFGITFTEHPDLRRILLPHDWEGHPLRKDYENQELYRGIKVTY